MIVIRSKGKQESNQTRFAIKENIAPKELSIALENVKHGSVINCNNKYTTEKITEIVQSDLNDKYTVVSVELL